MAETQTQKKPTRGGIAASSPAERSVAPDSTGDDPAKCNLRKILSARRRIIERAQAQEMGGIF